MKLASRHNSVRENRSVARQTVLVVEDSKELNMHIQNVLHQAGFRTDGAFSGEQAIGKLAANQYAVVLLDYILPDMTGRDVVKDLAEKGIDFSFIIVTGQGNENLAVEMMKLGAKDYMVKDQSLLDMLPHVINKVIVELAKDRELSEAEEALRQSEARFRGIFDSADFCISLTDINGCFILFNSRNTKALGYTPDELKGKTLLDITHPDDTVSFSRKLKMLVSGKVSSYNIENRYIRKNGSYFWAYSSVSPIFGTDRSIQAISCIVVDITERKQVEEKLQAVQLELENKVRERTLELSKTVESLKEQIAERSKAEKMIQLQFKRLNTLRSTERAITGSNDLRVTLEIILDQVTTQLEIDAASVLLMNEHARTLEYVVSRGFRTSALKYTRLRLGESNAGRAAIDRCIVTIPDLQQEPDSFICSKQFSGEGFTAYIAVPLIAKGQVMGVLELFNRTPLNSDPEWLEFLETIASQAAIAIEHAALLERFQNSKIELFLAYDTTIEGWSRVLDLRDKAAEGHTRRVTDMTVQIAEEMGIKQEEIVNIRRGALLHDIGKMGVPDSVLLKTGPLTDEELEIMKRHPDHAYDLLYPIEYLRPAFDIPYCHHEKWDGTGYPRGLKGEEIPLSARIFAVADVFDELLIERPDRPACSKEETLENIRSLAGTHLDPKIVDIFLRMNH